METSQKESIKVLYECIDLQVRKGQDYQNPNSNVKQAMHYRRGIDSIHDILQGKLYRAQSLLESNADVNFESLEDTYKDLINYASFAVEYLRGKMDGQDTNRDMFNRPQTTEKWFTEKMADASAPMLLQEEKTASSNTPVFTRYG